MPTLESSQRVFFVTRGRTPPTLATLQVLKGAHTRHVFKATRKGGALMAFVVKSFPCLGAGCKVSSDAGWDREIAMHGRCVTPQADAVALLCTSYHAPHA